MVGDIGTFVDGLISHKPELNVNEGRKFKKMSQLQIETKAFVRTARGVLNRFRESQHEVALATISKIEQRRENYEMTLELSNKIYDFVNQIIAQNATSYGELTEHLLNIDLETVRLNEFKRKLPSSSENILSAFHETLRIIRKEGYNLGTVDMLTVGHILENMRMGEYFSKFFPTVLLLESNKRMKGPGDGSL